MPEEENLVKTTWRMPKHLLKRVKQYGLDTERTTTEIANEALEEYLDKRNARKVAVPLHKPEKRE